MLSLLRFLRGYVCFIITGSFPQRLLNNCRQKKIPLWDIKAEKGSLTAKTYASKYKRLKGLRKNRMPKIKITEKHGLPFITNKYRSRYGLFAGIIFSAVLFVFLSERIWIININTDDQELKTSVESSLEILGIERGIKRSSIDTRELKRKLMITDSNLSWDSFNKKGCMLNIEVNKKIPPPVENFHKNKYADLIAECDGQIIYIEADNGKTLCEKGQTVAKGDILVSGTIVDKYGGIRCVYSSGEVYALCQTSITAAVIKKDIVPVPSGKKFYKLGLILGKEKYQLDFSKGNNENIKLDEYKLFFPHFPKIGIIKELFQPVKYNTITLNYDQLKKKAADILKNAENDLSSFKVVSKKLSSSEDDKYFYLKEDINFIKNIAITREF